MKHKLIKLSLVAFLTLVMVILAVPEISNGQTTDPYSSVQEQVADAGGSSGNAYANAPVTTTTGQLTTQAGRVAAQADNTTDSKGTTKPTTTTIANPASAAITSSQTQTLSSTEICKKLFTSDPNNIFSETICQLSNVISVSISDFAKNIDCSIQAVGNSNNYVSNLVFAFDTTQNTCDASTTNNQIGLTVTPAHPFGDPKAKTGIFASGAQTSLSKSLFNKTAVNQVNTDTSSNIYKGYTIARGVMTALALVALFVFAFANILHIEINTYAIKKALPALVIAVVGGWLSIYIIFLLARPIDLMYHLNIFSPENALNPIQKIIDFGSLKDSVSATYSMWNNVTGGNTYSLIGGFVGAILIMIPAAVVFAFEFTLGMRPFIVGFLTIAAPIAFACMILPQTQPIFKKWWTYLLLALFYTPIVNFVFYLVNLIPGADSTLGIGLLANWAFRIVIMFLLVRFPFTIESDLKKVAVSLSKTSFGASLGLGKIIGGEAKTQNLNQQLKNETNKVLSSNAAKTLIASNNKLQRNELARTMLPRNNRAPIATTVTNLDKAIERAGADNLARPSNLMLRSAADLSAEAFRKVLSNSDIRLAKDSNLLNELKNKNGQILNEDGAAMRADSIRKLARLSQVVEGDKLANPDAIKMMAQKGVLDNLPLGVLKKALDERIINQNDMASSFKDQSLAINDKIANMALKNEGFLSGKQAKDLMIQDQKDNQTGFRDLAKVFSDVVGDPNVVPPPSPSMIKNIVDNVRTTDKNIFEKNGMYFLERLGDINRDSKQTISSTIQRAGAPFQTASAIASNPNLSMDDVKNYVKAENITPEALGALRDGFLNRDLSNEMSTYISKSLLESRTAISKSITQKIAEQVKDGTVSGVDQVKDKMEKALQNLGENSSPETVRAVASEVDQYYPGSLLRTDDNFSSEDINQIKDRIGSVVEVVTGIFNSGASKEEIINETPKVQQKVEGQIAENIRKTLSGENKATLEANKQAIS